MSRSRKISDEEHSIRDTIKQNLKTILDTINDYELTPDSLDFENETRKLRDNLLTLALKFHVLINAKGSKDLIQELKAEDPNFSSELMALNKLHEKSDDTYLDALTKLATDIAIESQSTLSKVGTYKLSDEQLAQLAQEAMERVTRTTEALRKEILEDKVLQAKIKQPEKEQKQNSSQSASLHPNSPSSNNTPRAQIRRQPAARDGLASRVGIFSPRSSIESDTNEKLKKHESSTASTSSDEKTIDRETSPNITKK